MDCQEIRSLIRAGVWRDETALVQTLIEATALDAHQRAGIERDATALVEAIRLDSGATVMESFLAEYGLTTDEGIALMCLAEGLLRVPDADTIDALISDKIAPSAWGRHLGRSSSSLVNASTWGLMLTGRLLRRDDEEDGVERVVHRILKRLGEPLVRRAVAEAMKELGRQFVFGQTIREATQRAAELERGGYTYSYDMLGEAAMTDADANRYLLAYADAINWLAQSGAHDDVRTSPGISVKLSALHPRYEQLQRARLMAELVPRVTTLATLACAANVGFNIDAEEADRLDISLDVIEAVLANPTLARWHGFGVVVQAYGRRSLAVIDWLYALAERLDRRIMVRLVKGAYWDAEIKRAQALGLESFPVFTRKAHTDIAFLACARKLLGMGERVYPQFATHNAHTVSAVLSMARTRDDFEFQRLHGMGEALHAEVMRQHQRRCRIYAPVGAHRDLLAYLVRRLLENGANSSFVNQIVDSSVPAADVARDPMSGTDGMPHTMIAAPSALFGAARQNARGWDITDIATLEQLQSGLASFKETKWRATPVVEGVRDDSAGEARFNPGLSKDCLGHVVDATATLVERAVSNAVEHQSVWATMPAMARAACLKRTADLYESHAHELFALLMREAGKTLADAVAELREAVDFLRFYANENLRLDDENAQPCGAIVCISPWNFPLAIFTGQIAGALAAGNVVLAKPAPQTPFIAVRAVQLMREAGVPPTAVQLLTGGGDVGACLVSDPRIGGVCFTGSTATAHTINRLLARTASPLAPLIAETGGLNAMIVDSTALLEQAVRDIVVSAFQSAGQRCSALRILYVQEDIASSLVNMLEGAMRELRTGDTWHLSTDIGPVIDAASKARIDAHIDAYRRQGRVVAAMPAAATGHFVAPTLIRVDGIEALRSEVFGPVLHVASFKGRDLENVIAAINAKGYGLTFGLHTRVDSRVQQVVEQIRAGNLYINRNQIGAVVGSQPFGGEGLSGTGPKAGGPHYVARLLQRPAANEASTADAKLIDAASLQRAVNRVSAMPVPEPSPGSSPWFSPLLTAAGLQPLARLRDSEMPGPTGESNRLYHVARGLVLCLGPDVSTALAQAVQALTAGNAVVVVCPGDPMLDDVLAQVSGPVMHVDGHPMTEALTAVEGIAAVVSMAEPTMLSAYRQALAVRDGPIIPLITTLATPERFYLERHLCVDTTASGGNASLLSISGDD